MSGTVGPRPESVFNRFSFTFDGTDEYIDCGDNNNLSFGNGTTDSPFSISAWVNMIDATRFRIVNKGANFSNDYEYLFSTGVPDTISFNLYDSSTGGRIARRYNTALTSFQGQWIHLAATYDGSSASSGMKIYLNGLRVDDVQNDLGSYTAMENGTSPFEIGASTSGGVYSNGAMDEVAIFSTELSASDVTSIYNSGVPNDISAMGGLVSWWRMGDKATYSNPGGPGNWTLTDQGSVGNDGTSDGMDENNRVLDTP